MLKRLDGLRGALDGEAARAMDAILAGFADDRKKWAATTHNQPHRGARSEKPSLPSIHAETLDGLLSFNAIVYESSSNYVEVDRSQVQYGWASETAGKTGSRGCELLHTS